METIDVKPVSLARKTELDGDYIRADICSIFLTQRKRMESAGNMQAMTYVGIDTAGHPSCRRLLARYSGAGASLAASGTYRLADRNDLLFSPPAHLSNDAADDDVEVDVDNDNVDDGDDLVLVRRARST